MKYLIVIPDGAADAAQQSLGGKTPLQAARTPAMDALASRGRTGLTNHVPQGHTCVAGSFPAANLALLTG